MTDGGSREPLAGGPLAAPVQETVQAMRARQIIHRILIGARRARGA
jgi:hypothetical protein